MKHIGAWTMVCLACLPLRGADTTCRANDQPATNQATAGQSSWTKTLEDRAQRGTLHNATQQVRGDSGRWSDVELWLHAPPMQQKPANMTLDDWIEKVATGDFRPTDNDDNWLLLRTRQLNDNDRVWVERVERRGNQIVVVVHQATWRGKYLKNFTCYQNFGVNLGRLEPGDYQAKCLLVPVEFNQFTGTGQPKDNWPKDEHLTEQPPTEWSVAFTVVKNKP